MSKEDRDRADARFNKAARTAGQAKAGGNERDAASKAVLDNMARLKALRLAREASRAARGGQEAARQVVNVVSEEDRRKGPGAGRLAGGPAERRPPDLVLTM